MKKKFKDTKVGKFLKGIGSGIGDILEGTLPDRGVLGVVKRLIKKDSVLTPDQKEIALKELEMDLKELEEVSKRWDSDMISDSWLSKNVRPLTLLYLLLVMTILVISDSIDNGFQVKDIWITLVESLLITVIIAYFGSRGIEKYTKIKK